MALTVTPTHPDANSYISLADANTYFANRTDVSDWSALTDDQKEAVLKLAVQQIDSLRFFSTRMIEKATYYRREQNLQFPRADHEALSGSVDSATTTTIVDASLASHINYPDDYWNGGAVIITSGTGRGQTALISDFDSATGTVTVSSAFSTTPDSTSQYMLIAKIDNKVKYAQCEQALYLVKGGGERAKLQSEGVKSYSIGDLSETFGDGAVGGGQTTPIASEARGHLRGLISRIGKMI